MKPSILYNITISLEPGVDEEWLQWMKEKHIPDMLATGLFLENRLFRLMNETEHDGSTYSVQYFLKSWDDLEIYIEKHSQHLQNEHAQRFQGKFVAFRTLLEAV